MNAGVFPKKQRNGGRKLLSDAKFRELETKLNDELYIQAAVYRLASILCEQLMNMKGFMDE